MACNRYDQSDEAYNLARMTGEWPEEERINVIGQNGNEGSHYVSDDSNKYKVKLRNEVALDVYDVLDAFDVQNPAIQHAIKKLLCTGNRGYKDFSQDLEEAIQSLERAKSFPPRGGI